ncbi:MAG: sulfatase-like hydrolase/transferase [Bacteroides sp.]|nr:sulfatase-like hydrolase/transferase [Bacteroides sp.]
MKAVKAYPIPGTLIFGALLTWLAVSCGNPARVEETLPNVVFVLADDIGFGDLATYGGKLPTPNLDRLAAEGIRFTDAHSPAALCAPSRFSMLTGSYPYRSESPGGAWNTSSPSIFNDNRGHTQAGHMVTVGEVLQKAGYRTAFFGKSHLGGDVRDSTGVIIRDQLEISRMDLSKGVKNSINEYGFDYSYSLPSGIQHEPFAFFENGNFAPFDPDKPADNRSSRLWSNGRYAFENGSSEIVEHGRYPGIGDVDYNSSQTGIMMLNKALDFITNHQEANRQDGDQRPFLLYFASQAIHVPHTVPFDYDGKSAEINEPVDGITGGPTGDFVYELDVQVGKLLEKLEEEGLAENTIFIFTSDNGALWPNICDFGNEEHDNNGPLRGYKASVYEGGHRVPFIIKWPGKIEAGQVSDELVLAQDWVATMYELTDQDMPEDQALDCSSLMSIITGTKEGDEPLHPFVLYQAGYAYDGAIREGDWVLTVNSKNLAEELFHLRDDPGQENNLIEDPQFGDMVKRLRAKFIKYNDHNNDTREPRTTAAYRTKSP